MTPFLVPERLAAHRSRNFRQSVVLVLGMTLIVVVSASLIWSWVGAVVAGVFVLGLSLLGPRVPPETIMRLYNGIPVDAGPSLERLNFRYRIEGRAPWKPLRAFDDGSKVYIQFGDSLPKGEAPPLFVASSKGEPALVNYRVRNNTYVVDRLFAVAELRLGRNPQSIIRIIRNDAIQPRRFNFVSERSRR